MVLTKTLEQFAVATLSVATPQVATQERPLHFHDLLIRDDPRLDEAIVAGERHIEPLQKLLMLSVGGTTLYGCAVGLAAQFLQLPGPMGEWLGRVPLLTLPLALTAAFLLALAVCLPSFYFYTQLSGLDASFRLITMQALRIQARTSILLLGVLPVYAAIVLGSVVGVIEGGEGLILLGVLLPFVVGLAGLTSLYKSFERLGRVLPVAHVRRPCFLSRMVMAWGMVYAVVCPVALYRIGEGLAALFS
jgi:hypothetical protein